MFAIQRLDTIMELLQEKGNVQVTELVSLLNVSDVTVRKDLNRLQEDGLITKTHGGAILNKAGYETSNFNTPQKPPTNTRSALLAKAVTEYIQDGDTLFLGSGNTCTSFAQYLGNYQDLSIITNNIEAIPYLRDKCKTVILIGGEVIFHESHIFSTSSQILHYLQDYNINKVITSCSGLDINFGISVSTEVSRNIFNAVLKTSSSWYLVVESTKFDSVSPYKIDDINRPDIIFTDYTDQKYLKYDNIKILDL